MLERSICALLLVVVATTVHCQTPIPFRPSGYIYQPAPNPKVVVEVFYDHLCIDSKGNWPVLQALKAAYSKDVEIIIHIFPLPYHHNAYFAQEAGEVVRNSSIDSFDKFIDTIFKNQDKFLTGAVDMTEPQVKTAIAEQVESDVGIKKQIVMNGYDDDTIVRRSRYSWKYAASRGVTGTPTFMVNGVQWADGSGYSISDWKKMITQLMATP